MLKGRNTVQKLAIVDALKQKKDHPCAALIHERVRKTIPGISLATVYRNLETMAESGYLVRILGTRECRYDFDTSPHHHLLCLQCRELVDIPPGNSRLRPVHPEHLNGCRITSVQLMFFGYCSACNSV